MAEELDAERSFPATPKRIEQAREDGRVARSRELATAAIMLGAAVFMWGGGPALVASFRQVFTNALTIDHTTAVDAAQLAPRLHTLATDSLVAALPLLGVLLLVSVAAPLLLSGWIFSLKAFSADFSRLNPARGLGNMISQHSVVELAKTLAKAGLLGGIAGWAIWDAKAELLVLANLGVGDGLAHTGRMVVHGFFLIVGGLVLIALIDVPYQLWHYRDSLKMTREEIRQEVREQDGDPQVKARIRSQQRAIARKRMMAAVPKADVIVTNPTHFAIALEYREGVMRAPRVVAKGAQLIAKRIREIGEEHHVPIVEAPPLARALFRHAEIGQEIPQALYNAVAQVLAYVFQLRVYRGRGEPPAAPQDLPVPPELDPLVTGAGAKA
jgi:flagellar biosynthesis protein FlhB